MKHICVIGMWHLGLVNAVGFAAKNYRVTGFDLDKEAIKQLKKRTLPIFEPGLKEAVLEYTKRSVLRFTDKIESIRSADYVMIAYDAPINKTNGVDITPVVNAAKRIASYLRPDSTVVITSQVPLGTSGAIEALIQKHNKQWTGGVVYVPENLQLGSALKRFLQPDMLVIGGNSEYAKRSALELYRPFIAPKIVMDLRSAEMVKHALNAFLATSIAFGNEIANLCDRLGADSVSVAEALRYDKRIGRAPIFPGLGFSGGTLARDVEVLRTFARKKQYGAPLLESIIVINEDSFQQVIHKLQKRLTSLKGKTIGLLGLTYKANTSTLRQSPALKLAQLLVKNKARCFGYDPQANKEEFQKYIQIITRVASIETLADSCDALVLVTEWPEFLMLNNQQISRRMKQPILIDTKNFLDPQKMLEAGFVYEGYGRGDGKTI